MDGTGFGGFCSAFEPSIDLTSAQVEQAEQVVYGPIWPAEMRSTANVTSETVTLLEPRDELDQSESVVEVPQLNINGIVVGKQEVTTTTGLDAALDILEANGGYMQAWADEGIETVYRSGDTYYIEFKTPHEEWLVLGKRALVVDTSIGTIYGFSMW